MSRHNLAKKSDARTTFSSNDERVFKYGFLNEITSTNDAAGRRSTFDEKATQLTH